VLVDVDVTNSERGAAPVVQPRRKRGRPKKVKIAEPGSSSTTVETTTEEEEEEWDFFGELASHIENGGGATLKEEDHPNIEVASQTATGKANGEINGIVACLGFRSLVRFGGHKMQDISCFTLCILSNM